MCLHFAALNGNLPNAILAALLGVRARSASERCPSVSSTGEQHRIVSVDEYNEGGTGGVECHALKATVDPDPSCAIGSANKG